MGCWLLPKRAREERNLLVRAWPNTSQPPTHACTYTWIPPSPHDRPQMHSIKDAMGKRFHKITLASPWWGCNYIAFPLKPPIHNCVWVQTYGLVYNQNHVINHIQPWTFQLLIPYECYSSLLCFNYTHTNTHTIKRSQVSIASCRWMNEISFMGWQINDSTVGANNQQSSNLYFPLACRAPLILSQRNHVNLFVPRVNTVSYSLNTLFEILP